MGLLRIKPVTVVIAYRALTREAEPDGHGYAFSWPFRESPLPGDRVVVPGTDGPAFGIVLRTATKEDLEGLDSLETVLRFATEAEIADAQAHLSLESESYWKHARIAAGLEQVQSATFSEDSPEIPPVTGSANEETADAYGRAWYGIWKRAEEEGRAPDERAAYRSIAYRWFAVRKKGGNL